MLETKLAEVKGKNKKEEEDMRKAYKKADDYYKEQISQYDNEMNDATKERIKALELYKETHHDLE